VDCVEAGIPLLIENLDEDLDPILYPLIAKSTFKRGQSIYMKLGDVEVAYNPKFR
jgi:dynein heavy chain, axonemal